MYITLSRLMCVTERCSVLQGVAVRCSALQCTVSHSTCTTITRDMTLSMCIHVYSNIYKYIPAQSRNHKPSNLANPRWPVWYVCAFVCMYVCTHVYFCVCMYACMHACVYACVGGWVVAHMSYVCVCMSIYRTYMHACLYVRVCVRAFDFVCKGAWVCALVIVGVRVHGFVWACCWGICACEQKLVWV